MFNHQDLRQSHSDSIYDEPTQTYVNVAKQATDKVHFNAWEYTADGETDQAEHSHGTGEDK